MLRHQTCRGRGSCQLSIFNLNAAQCSDRGEGDMEVRALCITLMLSAPMLLVVSGADVVIVPSRLQLFEYEAVSFSCQGSGVSPEWRVRNMKVNISTCQKSTSSVNCTNSNAVVSDSGEHWCEGPGGERSSAVNVTVTGGSVVLDGPVLPVTEGEAVTLRCRSRSSVSNHTAGFYRDGLFIGSSSTGTMTVENVSTAHGGLYKCHISGAGESPQSPLTVREAEQEKDDSVEQDAQDTASSEVTAPHIKHHLLLWVVVSAVLALQLLLIGLLHWKKQLLLLQIQLSHPRDDLYAQVKKDKKKRSDEVSADAADNLSVCLETNRSRNPATERREALNASQEVETSLHCINDGNHGDDQYDVIV
ncbi:hypothetical protein INR49_001188, partial [Caranx melampygus]